MRRDISFGLRYHVNVSLRRILMSPSAYPELHISPSLREEQLHPMSGFRCCGENESSFLFDAPAGERANPTPRDGHSHRFSPILYRSFKLFAFNGALVSLVKNHYLQHFLGRIDAIVFIITNIPRVV